MITITLKEDFTLETDSNVIPAQYSSNIPFYLELPKEYQASIVVPGYVYYDGERKIESAIDNYSEGNFTIPVNAFSKDGILGIAFSLTKEDKTETTTIAEFEVRESVNTSFSLPKKETWQSMLQNFMNQYMDKVYTKIMNDLITNTEELQSNTVELQKIVNGLIKTVNDLVADVNKKIDNGDFSLDYKWEGTKLFVKKHSDEEWSEGVDLVGSTTLYLDDQVQNTLHMSSTRTVPTVENTVHVQFVTKDGKILMIETTAKDVKTKDDVSFEECLNGQSFYCGEEDGCILLGNYQEWLDAGKPVMPI